MTFSRLHHSFLLTLGLLGLSPAVIHAEMTIGDIVLIDFGTTPPIAGSNFNPYTDVVIPNGATETLAGPIINSNGAPISGIGFSVTNRSGQDTGRATGNTGIEGSGLSMIASPMTSREDSIATTTTSMPSGRPMAKPSPPLPLAMSDMELSTTCKPMAAAILSSTSYAPEMIAVISRWQA